MKQIFNQKFFKRLYFLGGIIATSKAITLPLYFLLPYEGVDYLQTAQPGFYYKFHFSAIFGLSAEKLHKAAELPKETLHGVTLLGIYYSTVPKNSFIILRSKNKNYLLSEGDFYNRFKLVKIMEQEAIFKKDGKKFILKPEQPKQSGKKNISVEIPSVYAPNEEGAVFVKKKEIKNYITNPKNIWSNIAIDQIVKNNKLQGFKVKWVKKNSIFDKMGLKKGDIIVGANNQTFHSLLEVYKIYRNILERENLKLTILRNNQKKEIEYEIF